MIMYRPLEEYAERLQLRLLHMQAILWCKQHQANNSPAPFEFMLGSQEFYPAEFSAASMLQLSELQLVLPCYQLRKSEQYLLHVARPGWWQRLWYRPRYWQLRIQVTNSSIDLALTPAASPPWRKGHYYFSLQLTPAQGDALRQAAAKHQSKVGKGHQTQEVV